MFTAYAILFRTPGAIKFSLTGIIGRMPVSMDSLALIFIVVAANGSYAIAGAIGATASIVVAISMPLWARISDRIGQRAILIRVVPLKLFGLSIFLLLVLNEAPVWTWFLSIIFAEAVSINLGGMVRRRWLHILSPDESTISGDKNDRHLVNTAYSLEALNDEFVFIVGPIIATACATSITPAAGLIAGMLFLAIGAPLFAIQRATEPPAAPKREVDPHPAVIKSKKLQAIVAPTIFVGGFFGAIAIATVAFTDLYGEKSHSGVLLAIWASGSAVAAVINGIIKWRLSHAARFIFFLFSLTVLSIPFLFVQSVLALGVALFFNGFAIAPLIVNAYGVAESAVPPGQITETLSWVVAGMPLGGALSSAIAGLVIDNYGAQSAYWVPLGFMVAALVATLPYFTTYKALIGYSSKHD
ncbi:MAG: MFS transporter [Actinomycetales bacterium]|nr:MAG: MFS transporter [Actinomycetales bacterium]